MRDMAGGDAVLTDTITLLLSVSPHQRRKRQLSESLEGISNREPGPEIPDDAIDVADCYLRM